MKDNQSSYFSFIILTYNEEVHIPRLLNSIARLNAPMYIVDSGSSDKTLEIVTSYGCKVYTNAFENHPKQWHFALNTIPIDTPWLICLDADQEVSIGLFEMLNTFDLENYQDINGIYFNRKNVFKGHWLKHGGYFPIYLLKMFRVGKGFSDLNENMDHRFIVEGKTVIWDKGYLVEENLKENQISFWINKHNRYSDLVAQEEFERMQQLRSQTIKPRIFGNPDEKKAFLKSVWWKLPLYFRPFIYFFQRFIFQLGFLDGKSGIIFHFLHAFWFRLLVDIKIDELKNAKRSE